MDKPGGWIQDKIQRVIETQRNGNMGETEESKKEKVEMTRPMKNRKDENDMKGQ